MLSARTAFELHSLLKSINPEVPYPAEGRTQQQVETYSIVRLLGSLSYSVDDFPLQLTKRERPDFLVELGMRSIGVEHTEATTENAAKEAFLRSKGHGPNIYSVHPMAIGEQRKTSSQLIVEIEADRPSPPWVGDSAEKGWATAMAHFVAKKIATTHRSGYQLFEENWLLIYDSWNAPSLNHHRGLAKLIPLLQEAGAWKTFSKIFILDESLLLDISAGHPTFHCVNHCR
ncbi:MAG TPA: hypothetical protein VFP88_08540 [Rhodanobacteraceae bacterium]|nr:hypothetical protein [Rhodanobacteraceae bacterium]